MSEFKDNIYSAFAKYINKPSDDHFADALMRVIITEIKLKSSHLDEYMILPASEGKSVMYYGELYNKSTFIKMELGEKRFKQAKELVEMGSLMDLNSSAEIVNWIQKQTGIKDGPLSSLNLVK